MTVSSEFPESPEPSPPTEWTPATTGDPAADQILSGLIGAGELSPDEEIAAYREALDALAQLLEEQPRLPGLS
ncbi:hypothetical protein [Citricoccus sp. K5]|uniref:hypothetical protein n=1 Tax=Citricoccus sp. K5 TaxID=2653135 RepID=UPI0012EFE7BA|nr:hypothetical protein [Citricoccus sp. K5]VXB48594.1 conserved hypothetical protein [Citricoccus sp. K5]